MVVEGGGCACSGGGAVVNLVSSGSARRLYRSEYRIGVGCKPRSASLGLKGYDLPVAGFQWLRFSRADFKVFAA